MWRLCGRRRQVKGKGADGRIHVARGQEEGILLGQRLLGEPVLLPAPGDTQDRVPSPKGVVSCFDLSFVRRGSDSGSFTLDCL